MSGTAPAFVGRRASRAGLSGQLAKGERAAVAVDDRQRVRLCCGALCHQCVERRLGDRGGGVVRARALVALPGWQGRQRFAAVPGALVVRKEGNRADIRFEHAVDHARGEQGVHRIPIEAEFALFLRHLIVQPNLRRLADRVKSARRRTTVHPRRLRRRPPQRPARAPLLKTTGIAAPGTPASFARVPGGRARRHRPPCSMSRSSCWLSVRARSANRLSGGRFRPACSRIRVVKSPTT